MRSSVILLTKTRVARSICILCILYLQTLNVENRVASCTNMEQTLQYTGFFLNIYNNNKASKLIKISLAYNLSRNSRDVDLVIENFP